MTSIRHAAMNIVPFPQNDGSTILFIADENEISAVRTNGERVGPVHGDCESSVVSLTLVRASDDQLVLIATDVDGWLYRWNPHTGDIAPPIWISGQIPAVYSTYHDRAARPIGCLKRGTVSEPTFERWYLDTIEPLDVLPPNTLTVDWIDDTLTLVTPEPDGAIGLTALEAR